MEIKVKTIQNINVDEIRINARIRYPEDAATSLDGENWTSEDNDKPIMPCLVNENGDWFWKINIDVESGKITNWQKGIFADIYYKVCDEFECDLYSNGLHVMHYGGYVPMFMAIEDTGYGDYIYINIDSDGQIIDWSFDQDNFDELTENNYA